MTVSIGLAVTNDWRAGLTNKVSPSNEHTANPLSFVGDARLAENRHTDCMASRVHRTTVDLSPYPDLVVIYLGMRVNALRGVKTLAGFGMKISAAVAAKPDGLLLHESLTYSLWPLHLGMRQYWRDFDALETWARSLPHQKWWTDFVRDSGGTGFWHETYFRRGGMEAIYDDVPVPLGFSAFAPSGPARGAMFSARARSGVKGEPAATSPVKEEDFG